MYRRKIAAWGIERRLKQNEVKYMITVEHLRRSNGKDTSFFVHGRRIDAEDLRRYVRRKKLKVSDVISEFSKGNLHRCDWIECSTPKPDPSKLKLPQQHQATENLYHAWKNLIRGTLESDMCFPGETGLIWIYPEETTDDRVFKAFGVFHDFLHYSRSAFGTREIVLLRHACLLLENVIECSSFQCWVDIVQIIASLISLGQLELAQIVVDHLRNLLQVADRSHLPHFSFLCQLVSVSFENFVLSMVRLFEILVDIEQILNACDQHFTWQSRVDLWRFRRRHNLTVIDTEAFHLLQEGIDRYGSLFQNKMTDILIDDAQQSDFDLKSWYRQECAKVGIPILDQDRSFDDDFALIVNGWGLDLLSYVAIGQQQFNMGELQKARLCWIKALEASARRDIGLSSTTIHYVLEFLDYLSTESKIADGDLRWRYWKAEIECLWQNELEMACMER